MRTLYRLTNYFKKSYGFQYFILCAISILFVFYIQLFLSDIGGYIKALDNNTEAIKNDSSIIEVVKYSVNEDGSVNFTLADGTSEESSTVSFVFIRNDDSICSYSVEDNVIISPVSSDLWLNFLSGSNYFTILAYTVIFVILGYLLRKKDYTVLSAPYTLWILMFLFVIVSASGLLAYYKLR